MPFNLTIPRSGNVSLDVTLDTGETLFVLGANGTGKSSLMHRFYSVHRANARRISAHRQTWFSSNAITLSPEQKRNTDQNILDYDTSVQSRWQDNYPQQRPSIAIYNLIDADNIRAREIAGAADADDMERVRLLAKKDAPLKIINELLQISNLPIKLDVPESDQIVASRSGGTPYSVTQLSDGERNALLIAADVLTVKSGTLVLIDEPERHLHRSIISPLLTELFAKRPDCTFIVSTHEVMLPLDNPGTQTLLIRGCTFTDSTVTAWDADLISSETDIDDDLKREILGARRKMLFIEGTERSLDKPLYSLIFPNVSIISKSSCRDVEHAVSGIRDADTLHWIHAFGIVDNDRRTPADIERLKGKGIYTTSVYAVESIYYHPEIQRRVTERHVAVIGGDNAVTRTDNAKAAAIASIMQPDSINHLSRRTAEKIVRENFMQHLPTKKNMVAAAPVNINIDVARIVADESKQLQDLVKADNLSAIIEQYPIRETPAIRAIIEQLGFQSREQYEGAVRKLLMDDAEAREFARSLFGTLSTDITAV